MVTLIAVARSAWLIELVSREPIRIARRVEKRPVLGHGHSSTCSRLTSAAGTPNCSAVVRTDRRPSGRSARCLATNGIILTTLSGFREFAIWLTKWANSGRDTAAPKPDRVFGTSAGVLKHQPFVDSRLAAG
jgi:hypothetical protein